MKSLLEVKCNIMVRNVEKSVETMTWSHLTPISTKIWLVVHLLIKIVWKEKQMWFYQASAVPGSYYTF